VNVCSVHLAGIFIKPFILFMKKEKLDTGNVGMNAVGSVIQVL